MATDRSQLLPTSFLLSLMCQRQNSLLQDKPLVVSRFFVFQAGAPTTPQTSQVFSGGLASAETAPAGLRVPGLMFPGSSPPPGVA